MASISARSYRLYRPAGDDSSYWVLVRRSYLFRRTVIYHLAVWNVHRDGILAWKTRRSRGEVVRPRVRLPSKVAYALHVAAGRPAANAPSPSDLHELALERALEAFRAIGAAVRLAGNAASRAIRTIYNLSNN
jgi:hypothetical protein